MIRWLPLCLAASFLWLPAAWASEIRDTLGVALPSVLKVYGAGGYDRLEAYQTAVLLAGATEALTADTPALDGGAVVIVTSDGVRHDAQVARIDRRLGVAWLEVGDDVSRLAGLAPRADGEAPVPGENVWVLSNAFGVAAGAEIPTVQSGVVMGRAVAGDLQLTTVSGPSRLPASTPMLLLDVVTSNPGTAGAPVLDSQGRLIAIVGPERRSKRTGGWVNYAIPIEAILTETASAAEQPTVEAPIAIVADPFGLVLIPPVTETIPPYITHVRAKSPAAVAGLRADDLIVAVDGRSVSTRRAALRTLCRGLQESSTTTIDVLRDDRLLTKTLTTEEPR